MAIAPAIALGVAVGLPQTAAARGRDGFRRGPVVGGLYGAYGFPYYGFGFNPYFAPYGFYAPYGPYLHGPARVDMNLAAASGLGAIDLNVKPGQAEVWVASS